MKRLGLLARADQGGIAAQCWQFANRMKPDKILVCHTDHKTRGLADPSIYDKLSSNIRTCRAAPRPRDAEWFTDGVDTVFTVECWYGQEIPLRAQHKGVKTVVQGNPEMTGGGEMTDVMLAPTTWRLDALPGQPIVLPFPTDLELLPRRVLPERIQTLYHVHSSAMCDRNGTELLLEACGRLPHELNLLIRGGDPHIEHRGLVTVHWLGHFDGMFYDHWPQGIDAMVLPRRFGGLCLPIQEAASLGLPIITLDVEPQRRWLPLQSLVPSRTDHQEAMRGGVFDVATCSPDSLAAVIGRLVTEPDFAPRVADKAYEWAQSICWESLDEHYDVMFRQ